MILPPARPGATHFKLLRRGSEESYAAVPLPSEDGQASMVRFHPIAEWDFRFLRKQYGPGTYKPAWFCQKDGRWSPMGQGEVFVVHPPKVVEGSGAGGAPALASKKKKIRSGVSIDEVRELVREAEQRADDKWRRLLEEQTARAAQILDEERARARAHLELTTSTMRSGHEQTMALAREMFTAAQRTPPAPPAPLVDPEVARELAALRVEHATLMAREEMRSELAEARAELAAVQAGDEKGWMGIGQAILEKIPEEAVGNLVNLFLAAAAAKGPPPPPPVPTVDVTAESAPVPPMPAPPPVTRRARPNGVAPPPPMPPPSPPAPPTTPGGAL